MVTSNHSLRQEPFRPPKPIFPPHFNNHISWLKCFVNRPRWDRAFQPTVKLWSLTLGLYSHLVISATLICPAYIPINFFHLLKTDLSDQHVYSAYDHIVKFHTLRLYFTLCKWIQSNLGFWIWRRGFRIPCTRCKFLSVNVNFRCQSLSEGLLIRILKEKNSRIFHSASKNLLDSGIQIFLYWTMYSFIGSLGKKRSVEFNLGERKGTSLIWRLKIYSGIHHVKISHFLSIFIQENN